MAITLYFAKVNLESEEIYKIYKDSKKKKELSFALLESLQKESCWERMLFFPGEDGNIQATKIEYQLHTLSVHFPYVEGWVYKKSKLHYNSLNENSNELVSQSVLNTEAIRFLFDLENELVGYDTKNRFGYKEFLDAFVNILNIGLAEHEPKMEFSIHLCSKGIGLDDIKDGLRGIGPIKELQIKVQPPNPQNKLLEELQELGESKLKHMREANVTRMETVLRSKGDTGLNLNSILINDELDKLQGIHANLPLEEANKNGYLAVAAISNTGRKFSSEEAKPFKRVINCLGDLKDACIDAFSELLS